MCSGLVSSKPRQALDSWLCGLERIIKGSMLGHVLLPLVTSMTHYNLRCLAIADHIMSQLAQLIIITSQVSSCNHVIKSQLAQLIFLVNITLILKLHKRTLLGFRRRCRCVASRRLLSRRK